MNNFELSFRWEFDDGYSAGTGGTHWRIIAADTQAIANAIARAMVGESLGPTEYIAEVLSVRMTQEAPCLKSLIDPIAVWIRVFAKLGISPKDVKFVYSYRIGPVHPRLHMVAEMDGTGIVPEIIGFIPWPRFEK